MIASPLVLGTSVRLFDRRGQIKVLVGPPPIVEESSTMLIGSNQDNIIIFGPVNGLYCVADFSDVWFTRRKRIALWNPSTREHFLLPHVPQIYGNYSDEHLVTSDGNLITPIKYSFYIFSVSKGEWRNPEGCIGVNAWNMKSHVGVFVRGACHWLYAASSDSGYTILALDMLDESHKIISFPIVGDEYKWSNTLIVPLNRCLALVNVQGNDSYNQGGSLSFDVWIMSRYGDAESWSILYQVTLPPGIFGRFLGIVKDRFYVGEGIVGSLVSYNLDSNDKECYGVLYDRLHSLIPYEESLVRIIKSV
ncbi:F-box/kelch-repeat protein At3g06240-like [Silene latifolia]|uniref:F-box/kelch-repeat protein At3g06240-like n=1 Tax=Silene latifolia TaxID=37657 RepID=UPI003D7787EB